MFFVIVPVIATGAPTTLIKTQGSIYTVNVRSKVIDGQSILVALRIKFVVLTGSIAVASTVI